MTRYNIGRFKIHNIDNDLREAQAVLAGLVVVRSEMLYHYFAMEYTAIGECFPAIREGDLIPEYEPILRYDGMGGVLLKEWVRVPKR